MTVPIIGLTHGTQPERQTYSEARKTIESKSVWASARVALLKLWRVF